MNGPVNLHNCRMCGEKPKPEAGDGVVLMAGTMIDLLTGEALYEAGYTVRCCNCGCSVSHEYLDEVVRLWNGAALAEASQ